MDKLKQILSSSHRNDTTDEQGNPTHTPHDGLTGEGSHLATAAQQADLPATSGTQAAAPTAGHELLSSAPQGDGASTASIKSGVLGHVPTAHESAQPSALGTQQTSAPHDGRSGLAAAAAAAAAQHPQSQAQDLTSERTAPEEGIRDAEGPFFHSHAHASVHGPHSDYTAADVKPSQSSATQPLTSQVPEQAGTQPSQESSSHVGPLAGAAGAALGGGALATHEADKHAGNQPVPSAASQAPLSQPPTSQAPLSQPPVTEAPFSQEPVSQAPISEPPFSQAPTTTQAPPTAQAPIGTEASSHHTPGAGLGAGAATVGAGALAGHELGQHQQRHAMPGSFPEAEDSTFAAPTTATGAGTSAGTSTLGNPPLASDEFSGSSHPQVAEPVQPEPIASQAPMTSQSTQEHSHHGAEAAGIGATALGGGALAHHEMGKHEVSEPATQTARDTSGPVPPTAPVQPTTRQTRHTETGPAVAGAAGATGLAAHEHDKHSQEKAANTEPTHKTGLLGHKKDTEEKHRETATAEPEESKSHKGILGIFHRKKDNDETAEEPEKHDNKARDATLAGGAATAAGVGLHEHGKHAHEEPAVATTTGTEPQIQTHPGGLWSHKKDESAIPGSHPDSTRDAALVGGTGATAVGQPQHETKHGLLGHKKADEETNIPEQHHDKSRDAALVGGTGAAAGLAAHEHNKHAHEGPATTETSAEEPKKEKHGILGIFSRNKDKDDSTKVGKEHDKHHDKATTAAAAEEPKHHYGRDTAIAGAAAEETRHHKHEKSATAATAEEPKHHYGRDTALGGAAAEETKHHHDKHHEHDKPATTAATEEPKHHYGSDAALGGAAAEETKHHHDKHHEHQPAGTSAEEPKKEKHGILGIFSSKKDKDSSASHEKEHEKHHHDKHTSLAAAEEPKHHHEKHREQASPAVAAGTVAPEDKHHGKHATEGALGAGAVGAGAYEASRGHQKQDSVLSPHGDATATGPASKTIGPHTSNIANIVDPRVLPDPAKMKAHETAGPHESDTLNRADPRVEEEPKHEHHYGRDSAIVGGAGLAGVAAHEHAEHGKQDPAQSTTGTTAGTTPTTHGSVQPTNTTANTAQVGQSQEPSLPKVLPFLHRKPKEDTAVQHETHHDKHPEAATAAGGVGAAGLAAHEHGKHEHRRETEATPAHHHDKHHVGAFGGGGVAAGLDTHEHHKHEQHRETEATPTHHHDKHHEGAVAGGAGVAGLAAHEHHKHSNEPAAEQRSEEKRGHGPSLYEFLHGKVDKHEERNPEQLASSSQAPAFGPVGAGEAMPREAYYNQPDHNVTGQGESALHMGKVHNKLHKEPPAGYLDRDNQGLGGPTSTAPGHAPLGAGTHGVGYEGVPASHEPALGGQGVKPTDTPY